MEFLAEDNYFMAINKPAGMPSQNDNSGDESLLSFAQHKLGAPVHIINRLDRPVGGIVLFAKDKKTTEALSEIIRDKDRCIKKYYAVVCGKAEKEATLEDHIIFSQRQNISKVVNKGTTGAKTAILKYKYIREHTNGSLIDIRLITGRHHQIRVQLSHAGIPIWGDTKYNKNFAHKRGVMPLLFCREIKFTHPITGEQVDIKAEPEWI